MWAPWRMAYVGREHAAAEDDEPACVFCSASQQVDDARAYVLHRARRAFVIMNLYPYNNGHLMVVPYEHRASLRDLDAETVAELMTLAQRSQDVLEQTMRPHGFNIGINQGRAAGAGIVDHVHLHLVPRWVGDTNFMPVLGDVRVMPQHLDETYALLRPHFDA